MPENRQLRVFLCHSSNDKPAVRELYRQLSAEGWMDVWLDDIPFEARPQVLIDIGYRDPAMKYGDWLIELLESRHVPYLLRREVGRHDYQYWSSHMPFYLKWFATDW